MNSGGFDDEDSNIDTRIERSVVQRTESVCPCTVKQLLNAEFKDKSVFVSGVSHKFFVLVGKVVKELPSEYEEGSGSENYLICDTTGCLRIELYEDPLDEVEIGTYISVYGKLRDDPVNRSFIAYTVNRVEEFDQVAYHLVRSLHIHNYYTNKTSGIGSGAYGAKDEITLCREIYEYIRSLSDTVTEQDIIQTFESKYPSDFITMCFKKLNDEGRLYAESEGRFNAV